LKSRRSSSKSIASPARVAAFEILLQVARNNSYASELLHSSAYRNVSIADHGLATELVMGTLRWLSFLDHRIAQVSSQPLTKLDLEVLTALRLAVYQLNFLDRIPASAAVNESVQLVKQARKHSAAGFVNAVLRKVGKFNRAMPDASTLASIDEVAAYLSHPVWMVERWVQRFGIETAGAICAYDQRVPETAVRISGKDALEELESEGIALSPGRLLNSARLVRSASLTSLAGFQEGRIAIQDEASQLVALLVGEGASILDCCAAPGGKTRILAEQNPGTLIVAAELHPHRARLLRKLVHNQNVIVVAADARALPVVTQFDRVLVDVPCSGTGTLARNPDIKWRLRPEDLADLQERQSAILDSSWNQLAPGGKLVYASCSLESEENEIVIESAVAHRKDMRILDCKEQLHRLKSAGELAVADLDSLISGPYLRTIPGIHQCDGFFAAILEKLPESIT
jgi:16S rRNA (cytosine967-C5)-methyltransferase